MTNQSEGSFNLTQLEEVYSDLEVFKTSWLIGIAVSVVSLSIQVFVLILIPNSRKYDEKVLLQMSLARFVNTVCEYCVCYVNFEKNFIKDAVFALYVYADFALICWMFIFTKNLYDKVVLVFVYEKLSLFVVSILVWTSTLLVGVLCPVLMTMSDAYFHIFYKVYSHVKFFVLILNALIFIEIFHVAVRIGVDRTKTITHFIKTAIIAFALVCITSLQVLTTDLLSYFIGENIFLQLAFCTINSYQLVAVTIIFIILAKNNISESMLIVISIKLKKLIS